MRLSRQRDLVHQIVKASHSHPTAEDVFNEARKSIPNISLGAIYRNLRQLAADGKIREVQFGSAPDRFDGMLDMHEHFICTSCGKVDDVEPTMSTPSLPGKRITNYRLDYFGLCESCITK